MPYWLFIILEMILIQSSLFHPSARRRGRLGGQPPGPKCFLPGLWTGAEAAGPRPSGVESMCCRLRSHLPPPGLGTEAGSRQGKQADNQVGPKPEKRERESRRTGGQAVSARPASGRERLEEKPPRRELVFVCLRECFLAHQRK